MGEHSSLDARYDFVCDRVGGSRRVAEDVPLFDRSATELVMHLAGRWFVGEAVTFTLQYAFHAGFDGGVPV